MDVHPGQEPGLRVTGCVNGPQAPNTGQPLLHDMDRQCRADQLAVLGSCLGLGDVVQLREPVRVGGGEVVRILADVDHGIAGLTVLGDDPVGTADVVGVTSGPADRQLAAEPEQRDHHQGRRPGDPAECRQRRAYQQGWSGRQYRT